jgi:glyoxylase-like metal-dependent hydrolase (beta-lactamase superfamily II)
MASGVSGVSGDYRFALGDFDCYALRDGSFNYPPGSLFANAPEAERAQTLQQRGLPLEHVTTPYTCLLVDTGQHKVMIDTGAGNIGAMAAKVFPSVDHSTTVTGQLLQNLHAAGLSPQEVDVVLITHAHPDHIGGTLDEAGRLVFGNAHYFIAEDEWRFWTSEAADTRAAPSMVNIARRNLAPLEKRVTLVQDGFEVVPGITTLATPGHTPGHLAVSVTSGAQDAERRPCLLHLSDVVLHPLHLEYPTWTPVFDMDPEQAEQSKRRVFDEAAREQRLLFGHHFPPFPSLGRVTKQGEEGQGGHRWKWHPLEATRKQVSDL